MKQMACVQLLSFIALAVVNSAACGEPSCKRPDAKNFVVATSPSVLADGFDGQWLLQNVETSDRIFLQPCSARKPKCYYAVNVTPGRYYFEREQPSGLNHLEYPVSRNGLWFQITGMGVDYIGDWTITRGAERVITKLEIQYSLKSLDEILAHCQIEGRKLYLDKTKVLGAEIVD